MPSPTPTFRTLAVDWSGARRGARSKIWVAEVTGSRLVRLENGRTREEVTRHLVEEADRSPELVVGLDFAFSFPAWFVRQRGHAHVEALWSEVDARAEIYPRALTVPVTKSSQAHRERTSPTGSRAQPGHVLGWMVAAGLPVTSMPYLACLPGPRRLRSDGFRTAS